MPSAKYLCLECKKQVSGTKNDRYRAHTDGDGEPCKNTSAEIPDHVLAHPLGRSDAPDVPVEGLDFATCPQCDRKVKLTRLGYFEPHDTTLRGGERCPVSGVRARHARRTETVPLPGDEPVPMSAAIPEVSAQEELIKGGPGPEILSLPPDRPVHETNLARTPMGDLTHPDVPPDDGSALPAGSSARTGTSSPESGTTSTPSPEPEPAPATSSDAAEETAPAGPFHMAPLLDEAVLQPFSHVSQPFPVPDRIKLADAMSERGREIAVRLRETFYAYTNRDHASNRSAQRTLGPSEAGSSCDRQIAMKLMGVRAVNPQEGWAPFVGTAVHAELANMFDWANGADSGRYVTEMRVEYGNPFVPRGTLDLLDRVLYMVDDHKLMGRYSLDQLVQKGPSETYRVQLHIYGLGAERAGEKVKEVALIAWPRQESSLDKLYVHVEPYDRKLAQAALDRVARIAQEVAIKGTGPSSQMEVAAGFQAGDDCKWCPFHLKGDKRMERGCPGK